MPGPYDPLIEGFKFWSPKSHLQGFDAFHTDTRLKLSSSVKTIKKGHVIIATANGTFDKAATVGTDEIQQITTTGVPTGGTFTISFGGQTTTALPYNATYAQVQAALEALSTIGAGNVVCAGGPLPTAVTITYIGDLSSTNVAAVTTTDSLTGGSTPATAVATNTAGVKGYVTSATRILGHVNEWDQGPTGSWPRMFSQAPVNLDGKFWTDPKRYVYFPDQKGMVYEGAVEHNVTVTEALLTNAAVSLGYNAYRDQMYVFTGDSTNAIVKVVGVPEGEVGKVGGIVNYMFIDGASEFH